MRAEQQRRRFEPRGTCNWPHFGAAPRASGHDNIGACGSSTGGGRGVVGADSQRETCLLLPMPWDVMPLALNLIPSVGDPVLASMLEYPRA
jgi:hypothetical protein